MTSGIDSKAVALAAGASALTYIIAKKQFEKKSVAERREKYEMDQEIRTIQNEMRKAEGLPTGTKLEGVGTGGVYLWEVERLSKYFPSEGEGIENIMAALNDAGEGDKHSKVRAKYNKLISDNECILANIRKAPGKSDETRAYIRAGPRAKLHFNPANVNAAIVTCGGLCPGLNNVVREVTRALFHLYGIQGKVYGIVGGYKGFYDPKTPPLDLTAESVEDIHHEGGTILGSSRGGFDIDKICEFIQSKKISQLYVIGGDGTHRGAFKIHETCMERGLHVAVAGIPKTIDNDVDYLDRSFGFVTSVESAQSAIRAAKVEASCNLPNGIGIVKLMGRSSGFIAAHASLGSGDVDLCLIPEVPIVLDGPTGCLPHLMNRVKEKGYAVVVVAEGAGEELLGASTETDASGNKKLPQIGEYMKKVITEYFKDKGDEATVKYIDPSYMIRSVPANATDTLYCMQLGQNAVHGTMAGYTGFSVGLCNNKMCLLPIPELVATSPRQMDPKGRTWERILAVTRQPNTREFSRKSLFMGNGTK
eukprot:CAMPEP_0183709164 /NCGR_PEP_ID=MMETSP0737-20130205/5261_1 /TAXON_ID=385413 /ORGANISM="Thalassiosira miniscula, Strain CCMP1093" /LENGTH=533 /DNA_ID=CAMNT_0025937181 /DNA_START=28 /DNA_END=1629 /DNA_ORIENTATION=+